MALTIRVASAFLVSALAAGCNQSLFDARLGGDDPAGDGGPLAPDARPGERDGGDERDGAPPVRPDARVGDAGGVDGSEPMPPDRCPAPCAGDAFADFNGTTNGANGRWRYVEVNSSFDVIDEMSSTTYSGGVTGWIGTGTPPPGIASCPMASEQLPCGDQDETLVFITTQADSNNHPGLSWTAPMNGEYRLRVDWTFPSTAPLVASTFYIIHDQYGVQDEVRTDAAPGTFGIKFTLTEGDSITLAEFSDTLTSTSLAVNFYITGPLSPAGFQGVQP